MQYMDSLHFITKKEGWFMNLVMCAICMIIPVIGPIVLFGYLFEVFDALRRDPERKDYPKFEFGQFSPYLMRGIWPFVIQIIAQLVAMIPTAIAYGLAVALTVATKSGAVAAIMWIIFILVSLVMSIAIALFTWPAITYAGVAQKLDLSGTVAYSRDFVRKMLKELILSLLFLVVAGWVLSLLGFLACCVGIYVAAAAMMLCQYHLKMQLYTVYLDRGGKPIPEKEPRVITPPPE